MFRFHMTDSLLSCKMKLRGVVLVLCICLLVSSEAARRRKRALWHFRSMIKCTIPDSLPLLNYADYGCFCGKGGRGTPVDDLDRCCQVHDKCYGDAMQHPGCWPVIDNPYTKIYKHQCDEATKTVTCPSDGNSPCAKFVCDCDRKAAICFAGAGYNPENRNLPSDRCQKQ